MKPFTSLDFIRESNRIEGIIRDPKKKEVEEYKRFMSLQEVTLNDMIRFVAVYQPGAQLRDRKGLNVRVGNYFPPAGEVLIKVMLGDILHAAQRDVCPIDAYEAHHRYESLHPFTDGNGRSGRMLWMWMMRSAPLGFLHTWYYQSLNNAQEMRHS